MSEVKRFKASDLHVACCGDTIVVNAEDFDAQRLRADTAEADALSQYAKRVAAVEELAAAEQRIALMSKLLSRCIPVCRFKNSHTERDLIAEINAALNPNPEEESHDRIPD